MADDIWKYCSKHDWSHFYAGCPVCKMHDFIESRKAPIPKVEHVVDDFGTWVERENKTVYKVMKLDEYQSNSRQYATYPAVGANWYYPAFGLAEEAGEVCGKLAKALRDDKGMLTPDRVKAIYHELGDVLWMVSNLASELRMSLNDIAYGNLEKLESRKNRGVISGSGDNR